MRGVYLEKYKEVCYETLAIKSGNKYSVFASYRSSSFEVGSLRKHAHAINRDFSSLKN